MNRRKTESYIKGAQKAAEQAINAGEDQYQVAKDLDRDLDKNSSRLHDWYRQHLQRVNEQERRNHR